MVLNGIDPSAKTPSRIRRDLARMTKGSVTSTLNVRQPIALDSEGRLNLNTSDVGGLTGFDVALAVNVDNATLAIATNTVKVKDGGIGATQLGVLTTKGDVLGFGTTHGRLPVGTDGQVLTADAASTMGIKWADAGGGTSSPLTTKGDVWVYSTTDARLPVGTDGQVLSADSSQTTGLKWIDAGGGSDPTAAIPKTSWTGTWSGGVAGGSLSDAWDGIYTASLVLSSPLANHFVINLGAIYTTSRVKITSQATTVIPSSYTIDVSLDGTTYTNVSSSVTASTVTDYTFPANHNAQYIRITPNSTTSNGNWFVNELDIYGALATGSVYSVGIAEGTLFTVSGSPITTFGTITLSLNSAASNVVFSGPSSGSSATPTFRSLVAADLPGGAWVTGTNGETTGSAFTLVVTSGNNGTWQNTSITVALPGAGTYLLYFSVHSEITSSLVGSQMAGRLFDATNSAVISNSELILSFAAVANVVNSAQSAGFAVVTATGAATIRLEANWSQVSGTPTSAKIDSGTGGRTKIGYIQLA